MLTHRNAARTRALRAGTLHVGALLAGVLVLAGCSGSSSNGVASESPAAILAASKAVADSATSVHVANKSSQGLLSLSASMQFASDGGRARVSFLGLDYELMRIGNMLYVNASPAFYRRLGGAGASAAAKLPRGTWLKTTAIGGGLGQLASSTDQRVELGLLLRSTGSLTKGATTIVDGQKAIELKETAKLFSGVLYVATTGKPYPIELVKHGRESGQITFSGWNEPITLSAPANATTIE
jgi:hypothetical protein